MKKFIGYIRVSTDKQNYGLDAQLSIINNYIKNKGELLAYYEDKLSGKLNERAGLQNALEHCKKERATLLIAKLDRLSRNVVFLFQIRESGVDIACCNLPDLNTLTLGIFATMAQHEREIISQRTKEGMAVAIAKGKKVGRKKGYKRHPSISEKIRASKRSKALTVNERLIKAALHLKSKNLPICAITRELNSLGFVAPKGGGLKPFQVYRVLKLLL